MNRITELFQRKDRNLLSVYFTAGYPVLEDTVEIIQMLENRGVDLVEIGIFESDVAVRYRKPFSKRDGNRDRWNDYSGFAVSGIPGVG